MKYIRAFLLFWYDFIVGDAWEVAAGVAITLTALYLISHNTPNPITGAPTLLLPLLVITLLAYSLWRVRKPH